MGAWRPVMYRSGNDAMSIEWYIVYIYLMMPYLFENVFFHMNVIFRGGLVVSGIEKLDESNGIQ